MASWQIIQENGCRLFHKYISLKYRRCTCKGIHFGDNPSNKREPSMYSHRRARATGAKLPARKFKVQLRLAEHTGVPHKQAMLDKGCQRLFSRFTIGFRATMAHYRCQYSRDDTSRKRPTKLRFHSVVRQLTPRGSCTHSQLSASRSSVSPSRKT